MTEPDRIRDDQQWQQRVDARIAENGRAANYRAALRALAQEMRVAAEDPNRDPRAALRNMAEYAEFVADAGATSDLASDDQQRRYYHQKGRAIDILPRGFPLDHIHWASKDDEQ